MGITVRNNLNLGGLLSGRTTRDAVDEAAKHVLEVAKSKAPVLGPGAHDMTKANDERRSQPGELRDSGYVRTDDEVSAEIGFTAYWARWQHEDLEYAHDDGQAKFLEEPMATEKATVLEILAAQIREALGG